jgi:glycerate kinase
MNILIAPNSYKECLDSVEITQIINKELSKKSHFKLLLKPLTDGGDGFRSVCIFNYTVNTISNYKTIEYHDHLSTYLINYSEKDLKVFIESAELFGMKIIPESKRNTLKLNSELLGKILEYLSNEVYEERLVVSDVYIGVGGTSTIDFGIGTCSHLGLTLIDEKDEQLIPYPMNFIKTKKMSFIKKQLPFNIKCVVDVETEFVGNPGAIEIFGKQKGASENDLLQIKSGIENLLQIISTNLGIKIPEKLNGAGGGLAAGLNLFYDVEIIAAKSFIKDQLLNEVNLDEIDVVITGEGSFDEQSFEGKGSGVILDLFKDKKAKFFLINGSTNLPNNYKLQENIQIINLIDFYECKSDSMKNIESGLKKACEIVLNQLSE